MDNCWSNGSHYYVLLIIYYFCQIIRFFNQFLWVDYSFVWPIYSFVWSNYRCFDEISHFLAKLFDCLTKLEKEKHFSLFYPFLKEILIHIVNFSEKVYILERSLGLRRFCRHKNNPQTFTERRYARTALKMVLKRKLVSKGRKYGHFWGTEWGGNSLCKPFKSLNR